MAITINSGSTVEIQNLSLNASTDVAVTGVQEKKLNNILVRSRQEADIQVRATNNATNYFTIPSGQSLTMDMGVRNDTPFYLRSATGIITAEVVITYE